MNNLTLLPLTSALLLSPLAAGCVRAQIPAPGPVVVGLPASTVIEESDASGQPAQIEFPDGTGGTTRCATPCRTQTVSGPRLLTVRSADGSVRNFGVNVPPGASRFALSYRSGGATVAWLVMAGLGLVGTTVCGVMAPESGLVPVVTVCGTSIALLVGSLIARSAAGADYADYVAAPDVAARRGHRLRFAGVGFSPLTDGGVYGSMGLRFE